MPKCNRNRAFLLLFVVLLSSLTVIVVFYRHKLLYVWHFLLAILEQRESIRDFVLSLGVFGPIGFMLLQALQVVVSPIPGEATGIVGGFIFGKWFGLLYSTIGLSIGSAAAFFISRYFRSKVEPWLKKSAMYWRFEGLVTHQGLFICFFMYVFPGFPKDFLCYLLGLSRMPWQVFLFISTVGRIPGTMMLSWQGADIYAGNWIGVIAIVVLSIAVAGPSWLFRERIYAWIDEKTKEPA